MGEEFKGFYDNAYTDIWRDTGHAGIAEHSRRGDRACGRFCI